MAGDYGDISGGQSDQTIRDIVAQLNPAPPQPVAAPVGVMPAPEVTPTMTYAIPQQAATAPPGPPMNLVPVPAAARRPAPDDWAPPVPVFTPPPVSPLGVMAALPRPAAPTLGQVLGRR